MLASTIWKSQRCPIIVENWSKEVLIEYCMQTKEGWSVELKIIATHNLGNSVWPITKWSKLPMGPSEMLLLQM
jgi:hypothetical protein